MNFPELLEFFDKNPQIRRAEFVWDINGKKFKVLAYTIIPKAGSRTVRIDIKESDNSP